MFFLLKNPPVPFEKPQTKKGDPLVSWVVLRGKFSVDPYALEGYARVCFGMLSLAILQI